MAFAKCMCQLHSMYVHHCVHICRIFCCVCWQNHLLEKVESLVNISNECRNHIQKAKTIEN